MQKEEMNRILKNASNRKYTGLLKEYEITTEEAKTHFQTNPPENSENIEDLESDDEQKEDDAIRNSNREIIENYRKKTREYENSEFSSDWTVSEAQKDLFFQNFQHIVAQEREQILRYYEDRSIAPLWVSSLRPKFSELFTGKCDSCGGNRMCEVQIMPHLLNLISLENEEDAMDWGTLIIYTCVNSCSTPKPYTTEILYPQQISTKK